MPDPTPIAPSTPPAAAPAAVAPPAPATPPAAPVPATAPDAPAAPAPPPPTPPAPSAPPPTPPAVPPAVPVTYALTVPEGLDSWCDASDLAEVAAYAQQQQLPPAEAQAIVATEAAQRQARAQRVAVERSAAYRAQLEADEVYGGAQLAESDRRAQRVLDRFLPAGTPLGDALRHLLVHSGTGNYLPIVALLANVGAEMAEDRPWGGGANTGGDVQFKEPRDLYKGTTPGRPAS